MNVKNVYKHYIVFFYEILMATFMREGARLLKELLHTHCNLLGILYKLLQ